ncbi:MAG: alpha-beta hydrolase superfamily lysophospholipase, partial [Thalassolituus oleivorans]
MAIGSRRLLGVAGALLIGLVFTALAGPRVDVSVEYAPFPEGVDLETWVRERAQEFDDIVPGTEHRLVWADSVAHRQTALSVVYLHGFSGTSAMAYPFVDSLAARLGANAYLPRLTGHGRTGEAFGEATLHEWIQDTADALAIGARLGEKVVLVGLSNGGALAAWAALQPDLAAQLEALVLLSPNIKPVDGSAEMLLGPWG